uniref:CBS domain-containing protein n=1 Tax=Kalanchoe fedtschenkoi TaxID=63787 RepID=A0A7N0SZU5_KALFE
MESVQSALPRFSPFASAADHSLAQFRQLTAPRSGRRRLRTVALAATRPGFAYSIQSGNGTSQVCEFMTKKDDLHVLKPSTPIGEALSAFLESEISSFPVIDEEWNLVGIVSDYDLLALASLPGTE